MGGTESTAIRPAVPSAAVARVSRISALDFTKGALVLIMVYYHWLNYFIGLSWGHYIYLRFLTPSFILVTGFLISNVYLSGRRPVDGRLARRLLTRGFKLLVLFVLLNAGKILVGSHLPSDGGSAGLSRFGGIEEAFGLGNIYIRQEKLVAFYILVPIGYLLILSAALVLPYRRFKYIFHAAFAGCFLGLVALRLAGSWSDNLAMVFIGMLGAMVGFVPIERVNRWVSHPYLLALAYAAYVAAITRWNVPFRLLAAGACLSVACVYLAGLRWKSTGAVRRHIDVLGQYSLLGYVGQIAILQVLSAVFHRFDPGPATLPVSFVAAFALTMALVEIVEYLRPKSRLFDSAYRFVFA